MIKFFFLLALSVNYCFGADYFTERSRFSSFEWSLSKYENPEFVYDIFYYIPASIESTKNAPALIFMHGGGKSTLTRKGANDTVKRYAPDLISLAEELGFVLILPSSNGLNWGGHTSGFIRDLATLVRKDLDIDPNNFGLAGHSMGGMGISRSANWLTDQFSFFLPTAAGMDPTGAIEENLVQNFNTVYNHQQGLKDHFTDFVTRCQNQEKIMKQLESKYSMNSGLKIEYYDGPHNYDRTLLKNALSKHFTETRRNLYQDRLFGSFYFIEELRKENNIQFYATTFNQYFWMEVAEANSAAYPFRANFTAEIHKPLNLISVKIRKGAENIKKLRLYLSAQMVDLNKPVTIEVNGVLYENKVKNDFGTRMYLSLVKVQREDKKFNFDSYTEVILKKE